MSTSRALSSTRTASSEEFQICFSLVLLLSLSPLVFPSPLFQRHETTPLKKLNKFLSTKMLQFVCPGLGSQNFLFHRLPIRQSFQLPIPLPKQVTCFQVIKAHARCSLVKKQKEEQVVLYQAQAARRKKAGNLNREKDLDILWNCDVKIAGARILKGNSRKEISRMTVNEEHAEGKMGRTGTRNQ